MHLSKFHCSSTTISSNLELEAYLVVLCLYTSVDLLFDLDADRGGAGAVSNDSDREATFAIGGGWHRH